MRVQPRQEILAIWKAIANWSVGAESWRWDGANGRGCVSDAELLLCLLQPQRQLNDIRFDRPDTTKPDVLAALSGLGDAVGIPRRIVGLMGEYLEAYVDRGTGRPVFPGGEYFVPAKAEGPEPTQEPGPELNPEQRGLDVVDAYATSVVLTVAIIEFLRNYRPQAQRRLLLEIDRVEEAARRRLTAAMVGLQRSFTVNVFTVDSQPGRALCRTLLHRDEVDLTVVRDFRHHLRDVMAGLGELDLPPDQHNRVADLLDDDNLLFECGWSWGIITQAAPVEVPGAGTFDQEGFAEPAPYLYFTLVAVDAIRDLFDERTRNRALLDDQQQHLARALNLHWSLARRYWATLASFETGDRWPLEDLPWRTTDLDETDYYSLMVTALVLENLVDQRAPDSDLERIGGVLEELANRNRVRRRPFTGDISLSVYHDPGFPVSLVGSEGAGDNGPRLAWLLADAATLLMSRTLSVAQAVNDSQLRARLLRLSDLIWEHVNLRRLSGGAAAGLWDQPANPFPELGRRPEVPSWYFTSRVVGCLGAAAELIQGSPPTGQRLSGIAEELLTEAEQLYDRELLRGSGASGPALSESLREQGTSLTRARAILRGRPATAFARTCEVLRELDKLAAARETEPGE